MRICNEQVARMVINGDQLNHSRWKWSWSTSISDFTLPVLSRDYCCESDTQCVCLYQLLTADVSPFILLHIYTLEIHVNAWVSMHLNLFYPSSFRADTDPDPVGLRITHRIRRFANDFVWEKSVKAGLVSSFFVTLSV